MSLAALSVFEFANYSADEKLYDLQVLSEDGMPVPSASGTSLVTTAFGDAHFDTVIIGGNPRVVPTSPSLLGFISSAAKTSRRISSICTGVFALADAGLLGNRRVTAQPIWTAAGNSAGIDLTLHMLEQDFGSNLAHAVARILLVDYQR